MTGNIHVKPVQLLFSVAIICLTLNGCIEKYYDIELPELQSKLVINSFFNEGERFRINVSSSLGRNTTDKLTPVTNARVILYENGQLAEELTGGQDTVYTFGDPIGKWFYFSKTTMPKAGKVYKIEVSAPGFEPVVAESMVPERTRLHIDDTMWVQVDQDPFLRVNLTMENPKERQWYYLATAIMNPIFLNTGSLYDSLIGHTKSYFTFRVNDPIIGKRETRIKEDFVFFSNELIPGSRYTFPIEINRQRIHNEDKISVDLASLSDEAYTYIKTITDFKNNDIRYSEPVKIYSNVENGQGIFAGINIGSDTLRVRWY